VAIRIALVLLSGCLLVLVPRYEHENIFCPGH
jgi:hypothetical protein